MKNIPISGSVVKEVMDRGHSGTIYLPKAWIGQRVVVQPLNVRDYVLGALTPYLEDVSGLFLYGSYARGEQSDVSDIDVLVVSEKKFPVEKVGLINIESGSLDQIKARISKDPVGYYSIVQEAVPLINAPLLSELKKIVPGRQGLKEYYDLTESALRICDGLLKEGGSDQSGVIYSLVLRLRGLYMLRCRMRKEGYSTEGLLDYVSGKGIGRETFEKICSVYRAGKVDGPKPKQRVPIKTVRQLYRIVSDLLKNLVDEPQKASKNGH
jgi:predicted nucleotidyltransferase